MQTLFWGGTLTKGQEDFQKWCWKLVMMLKLHPAQISTETFRQVEDWASPSQMGLTWGSLFQEEELVDVARAVRAAGLLATYVGLGVSSIGTRYVMGSVRLSIPIDVTTKLNVYLLSNHSKGQVTVKHLDLEGLNHKTALCLRTLEVNCSETFYCQPQNSVLFCD